jgi:hypothetical protein
MPPRRRQPPGPPELAPIVTLTGHDSAVTAVAFAAGGRLLVSGSADGTVIFWDVSDPVLVAQRVARTLASPRSRFGRWFWISPDARLLAVAGPVSTLTLWDVGDPARPVRRAILAPPAPARHRRWARPQVVRAAGFSPDRRLLMSVSADGTVMLWDITDPWRPAERATFMAGIKHEDAGKMVLSPDGRLLAAPGGPWFRGHRVQMWDIADPEHPVSVSVVRPPLPVTAIEVSPDGRLLAAGSGTVVSGGMLGGSGPAAASICGISLTSRILPWRAG